MEMNISETLIYSDFSIFFLGLAGSNKGERESKFTTVRQILRNMFTRNGVPKTIVTDKAPGFCEKSPVPWLRKIG